jgi:hypothetical protein
MTVHTHILSHRGGFSSRLKSRIASLALLALSGLAASGLAACDPTSASPIGDGNLGSLVPAGTPVRYVALGNSLTAGFQSGAVVGSETALAYPVHLANAFGMRIGDDATQFQYMQFDANGGIGGRLRITEFGANGVPTTAASNLTSTPSNLALQRPYNNLGIPGALLRDMQPAANDPLYLARWQAGGPLFNPFFGAVLRGSPTGFPLGSNCVLQAARLQPNVVSIWIGNNDALGYASSGGASGTNLQFFTMRTNPQPTEAAVFAAQFNALMDSCAARMPNAKFIVGNIPDVTAAPYFTFADPQVRATLQQTLATLPAAIQTPLRAAFPNFPNGFPIQSSAVPGGIKPLAENDRFLLTSSSGLQAYLQMLLGRIQANPAMAQQIIGANPVPNGLVLDEAEQAVVRTAVTQYNEAIRAAVARYSAGNRAVLFDAFSIVNTIRSQGVTIAGSLRLTFSYISGGFFSLDGIHPTSRGYAFVANEMIKLINSTYAANLQQVRVQDVPGLPLGQPN